jgi:16S rRNA (guanine527-N7)-methyltransferase
VFGDRLPLASALAALLGSTGLERGLIGPHELPRLWERHLLNCAVLTDVLPVGTRVVDVGSGAGLPGLALACRRADLRLDLVESLQRRVSFLVEAVDAMGLTEQVRIVPGRAEDAATVRQVGHADWVTARAVGPLDRLARWCLPLLRPGGVLLAMKGVTAGQELATHRVAIRRSGGIRPRVVLCGAETVKPPVRVVWIERAAPGIGKAPRPR